MIVRSSTGLSVRVLDVAISRFPSSVQGMCSTLVSRRPVSSKNLCGKPRKQGTHITTFLLGYVFAVAKTHLQVSSPSIKCGYPTISNNTSVALGVGVEEDGDDGSGFVCILTYDWISDLSLMHCSKSAPKLSRSSTGKNKPSSDYLEGYDPPCWTHPRTIH